MGNVENGTELSTPFRKSNGTVDSSIVNISRVNFDL